MKRLDTPVRSESWATDAVFEKIRVNVPASLLITNGVGSVVWYPSQSDLNDADLYFLGGHHNILSDSDVAAIEAAGFGDLIEDVP